MTARKHRAAPAALMALALLVSAGCQRPEYRDARSRRDANIQFVEDFFDAREARSEANLRDLDDYVVARRAYHARRLTEMDGYLEAEKLRREREWMERQPGFRQWISDLFDGDESAARQSFFQIVD